MSLFENSGAQPLGSGTITATHCVTDDALAVTYTDMATDVAVGLQLLQGSDRTQGIITFVILGFAMLCVLRHPRHAGGDL